jgi:hypothetical protein
MFDDSTSKKMGRNGYNVWNHVSIHEIFEPFRFSEILNDNHDADPDKLTLKAKRATGYYIMENISSPNNPKLGIHSVPALLEKMREFGKCELLIQLSKGLEEMNSKIYLKQRWIF